MARVLALLYGVVCYFVFFATFLYAIWFVWKMEQPRPATNSLAMSLLIDACLLGVFAVQHSVMARQWFKRAWTKIIPRTIERSTYVLAASLALLAIIVYWQPLPQLIWNVQSASAAMVLHILFWFGWVLILVTTFLIDHFDLFGLKQVWRFFRKEPYQPSAFTTPMFYRFVRHPLYLGFLIAFWCTPRMTADHLFFSVMTTAYILLAIQFEERDLMTFHGEAYKIYRSGVSMIVPWPARKGTVSE
jgi:protein-S-isoprenylcysteine O-methyltransferase Ste14